MDRAETPSPPAEGRAHGVVLALAGGVGGARMAQGLARVLAPGDLAIAVNVGDDFSHLGLSICPDLDTVMYTLAGVHNPHTGWGRADETWNFLETLGRIGGETWFRLGDHDLAVHVERTRRLREGESLSTATAALCAGFGIAHAVFPVTDDTLRTRIDTDIGVLDFQDYFVRRQCAPVARAFHYSGADRARPSPPLADLLGSGRLRAIVLCPSNPWLSLAPMFAVPALGALLDARRVPVVAVSPIVGGAAVKGPAGKIMRELGLSVDVSGIAQHYGDRVDGWMIDERDARHATNLREQGRTVALADTLMTDAARSEALAREVLALLDRMPGPAV